MEKFIFAFVVGGLICVVGQILMDVFALTPAHTMCTLVTGGSILGGFGLYDRLVSFAGAGAMVPISSFGNQLVKGALQDAEQSGILGIFTGMLKITSTGISAAIILGFAAAIVFRPKG